MSDAAPDERLERILAAAAAHFAAHGFEKTKLALIARDAEVAVGTIYLRHQGKSELLTAVLETMEQRFVTAMAAPQIASIPWPERLDAIFAAMFETALAEPMLPRLMAIAHLGASAERRSGDAIRAAIARNVEEAQAAGAFRRDVDPSLAAAITYGMVEGAMQAVMSGEAPEPGTVVATLTQAAKDWLVSRVTPRLSETR